jgi:hypothetical protein
MSWILGAVALSPFALCFGFPFPEVHLSPVTGRVTFSGRPVNDMIICVDSGGEHVAYGPLQADGTFRLINMNWLDTGALPGRYHAHLYTHANGPKLPSRYSDPETSGIEIDVASGWNDFDIELH